MVSSAPDVTVDYNDIDTTYFSVQKGFGLPAGLGIWILNDRCIEKALKKKASGASLGSYHSIPALVEKGKKYQTPETPNVLGIYLLGCIAEDMLTKGMDMIRRETAYKAAVLYQAFESSELLTPFVASPAHRSRTTTVAQCMDSPGLMAFLEERGIIIGAGYGSYKNEHIRIANFPVHSKEQIEMTVDLIEEWSAK
jgi:phosphoserine aminotransferase